MPTETIIQTDTFCIAGVRMEGRQTHVRKLKIGDTVNLVPDPTNKYSSSTIKVMDTFGNQLGFVPEDQTGNVGGAIPTLRSVTVKRILDSSERYPDSVGILIEYSFVEEVEIAPPTEKQIAKARSVADKSLSEEYEELIEAILMDGVVTADEETEARIFASGLPLERVRAVHAIILRKSLQKSVKARVMSDENERRVKYVSGFLARLGWSA